MNRTAIYLVALPIISITTHAAWAQPDPAQTTTHLTQKELCAQNPWYCGTTPKERERALQLFHEGEELHDNALLAAATTKYRAALEHWNHPRIHYYLMLALVKLDKPVEAYEHVVQALRYDADPLDDNEYPTALDYQKLLQDKVAVVEVVCDYAGAVVTLNGALLFTGPGRVRQHVPPGKYEILARKQGLPDASASLTLEPGKPVTVQLSLVPYQLRVITQRRWSQWKPWVLVMAGAGLGATGAVLTWRSQADHRAFLDSYSLSCPRGCNDQQYPAELRGIERRALWEQRAAQVTYGLAGAALVAGAVALFMNQPYEVPNPKAPEPVGIRPLRFSLAPVLGPDMHGVTAALSF